MPFTGKILLVDDEAHVRKYIGLLARGLGSPVIIEAANGDEALARYAQESPDLVLLDVNLPGMDGVQILSSILAQDPDAVVVMLTSLANRQTIEECLRLGATSYIRKDTPKEAVFAELSAVVSENLGKPEP
jgi:two-component system, chemotaxis family, chemotaxis protein CheY